MVQQGCPMGMWCGGAEGYTARCARPKGKDGRGSALAVGGVACMVKGGGGRWGAAAAVTMQSYRFRTLGRRAARPFAPPHQEGPLCKAWEGRRGRQGWFE